LAAQWAADREFPVMLVSSVLIEHFAAATAALSAGQRGGGVMAESPENGNPAGQPGGEVAWP